MDPDYQPQKPNYDFIMSPGQAPKKGLFGSSDRKFRIILVSCGGVFLFILIVLVFSAIFSGGKDNTVVLTDLAAEQQEIIRVAGIAIEKSTNPTTRNYAYTTSLSVTSEQQQLLAYLKSQRVKIKDKQLNTALNKDVDKALDTALQNNRFDEAFQTAFNSKLTTYQADLKQDFSEAKTDSTKAVIKIAYTDMGVILKGQ